MKIGAKIKQLRIANKLTLKELAANTNLSISFLSRLENEKTEPTMDDLRKIAAALHTSIINLFPNEFDEEIRIVRSWERKKILQPSLKGEPSELEFLLWGSKIQMEPTLMTIPPGGDSGDYAEHAGEEFLFVLEGELRFWCGDNYYDLQEGDTIGYPAKLPHRWENKGSKVTRVILSSSLPTF
ncbi:MAG: helix-turn-helix domain-containing protein [Zhaonellaceae bacterium]|jgi:transcriptional regulator with XRE-family HTH domain|nr:helix-turn-helix domain-containing protein [Clostridia bacterium]